MSEDADRAAMRGEPGSHSAYIGDDGCVVVEWYDFGADVPYESADMLEFDAAARSALAQRLGLPASADGRTVVHAIADRFWSYFDVRKFADDAGLAYRHRVDFLP